MAGTGNVDPHRYKVGRLLERYDLTELGEELAERWTKHDESLRTLETYVNEQVLVAALDQRATGSVQSAVGELYFALVDDEASQGERTSAVRQLERVGLDPEDLRREFVTHQAIYNYLTEGRGVSKPADDGDPVTREIERIGRLKSRTEAVATDSIDRLTTKEILEVPEFSVLVDVSVVCDRCGTRYSFEELLEEGCSCTGSPNRD
ncbi:rod-determining factor RdfA [Natrialbaceae archaeon A-gly3]